MNKALLPALLIVLLPHFLFSQNDLKIGEWRTHLPYRTGMSVTQAEMMSIGQQVCLF